MILNSPRIYPALKDVKWEFANKALCRTLVNELDSPLMPWVAFGYDHPHTFEFLNKGMDDESMEIDELILLENEALENLRQREMTWHRVSYNAPSGYTLNFLVCDDDFLAAERIIDVEFMQEAHIMLQTPDLFVGIPRRGILIAMNAQEGENAKSGFANFIALQYHRAESAPITPMVFELSNGIIVDCFADVEPDQDTAFEQEMAGHEIFVNVARLDNEPGDASGVYIFVGGHNIQRLAQAIQQSFMDMHRKMMLGDHNLCHYRIVPIPGLTPQTDVFKHGMAQLELHLQALSEELNNKYDLPPSKIEMVWGMSE